MRLSSFHHLDIEAKVVQVAGRDEAVSSVISWPANDQNSIGIGVIARPLLVHFLHC